MARLNTLTIRTPEGIAFSLTLAGPAARFLAWLIDTAVIVMTLTVASRFLLPLLALMPDLTNAMITLLAFLVQTGYAIAFEWFWRGQTLGKRLLRLRVMDETGLRLQFHQVAVRNLFRLVDMLPIAYLVGGAAAFFSKRSQRLGDFAANTIVVRTPRRREPDLRRVLGDKYNSFREHPHLCARLRQAVSPEFARTMLQALLRRDTLAPEARVRLFGELAGMLHETARFPEEATFGLTDEQYVRNAADVIFRTGGRGEE